MTAGNNLNGVHHLLTQTLIQSVTVRSTNPWERRHMLKHNRVSIHNSIEEGAFVHLLESLFQIIQLLAEHGTGSGVPSHKCSEHRSRKIMWKGRQNLFNPGEFEAQGCGHCLKITNSSNFIAQARKERTFLHLVTCEVVERGW